MPPGTAEATIIIFDTRQRRMFFLPLLLRHVTPGDLYRAQTVIRYGVTPAAASFTSSLSPRTFQIPQRRPHAGRLPAAHGRGRDLLPASRPGAVQSGAELRRQEGGAVERLRRGAAQGEAGLA